MIVRLSFLGLIQVAFALLGWLAADVDHRWLLAVVGAWVAVHVWLVLDGLRALRVLAWLKADAVSELRLGSGVWSEVYDRVRRLLRVSERQRQESDTRLQDFLAALQASPNGVVLLDADMRMEWFNQTAAGHFGFDIQRDLQQHFGNLVRDPGLTAYVAARDFSHDVTMPGRSNSVAKPVQLSVHMHSYGQGRLLLLSRDITAVEQAEAMRRDFVANVSHEIRTPLTVLAGFVETLQSLPLPEDQRQAYLSLMSQQAQRMQTLVNDLLTLSRLEGSPPPSELEWVSVDALMGQCEQEARDLSRVLHGRQHTLHFRCDTQLELAGSLSELHSALSNLVSNAVRYTPAGNLIEVHFERLDGGGARFCVRDSGPGIAPEHLPRLTERFYRVDRSRSRDTGGTGLGLAIVKHVAQRHGAELGIASTPGQGSTFSLTFPGSRVRSLSPALLDSERIFSVV